MSVAVALAAMKVWPALTAIVGAGSSAKISPLIKSQGISPPAITLQRTAVTPQNHLRGNGGLDDNRVQADYWATTYDGVLALAAAGRAAMEAAGHPMLTEFDNYDPETDPGLYRITQDFQVWA